MTNPLIDRGYLNHGYVVGRIAGHKVVVTKSIANRYAVEPCEHEGEILLEAPHIVIRIRAGLSHCFLVFSKESLNPVAEYLSRGTTKKVEVRMAFYELKGWDRGQVVVGHRPLSFFTDHYTKKEEALSKF